MISNYKLFLWLGIILLLIPFLGIPQSWKDFILFVVGLILVAIGVFQRNHEKMGDRDEHEEEIFIESDNQSNAPDVAPPLVISPLDSEEEEDEEGEGGEDNDNYDKLDDDEKENLEKDIE